MIERKEYYEQILIRYLENDCSPQEAKELFEYLQDQSSDRILLDQIRSAFDKLLLEQPTEVRSNWSKKMRKTLSQKIKEPAKVISLYRLWLPRVAAMLLLAASIGFYQYYTNSVKHSALQLTKAKDISPKKEAQPGGNKALLTLGDGRIIRLDETANGRVAKEGDTKINKANGELIYDATNTDTGKIKDIGFNTISTPKGGQYRIVLPDGSKVWLNAGSSLRFPTAFIGSERNVVLTGEGYFEIEKNASKPFHVMVNKMKVEVLGTHFNVMAYDNEEMVKTTLLEGSVKLNYGSTVKMLKPGQQGKLNIQSGTINIVNADVEETIAWKNGYFQFGNESIKSIMHQLERWYDLEVSYEVKGEMRYFTGEISRESSLSQVLKVLEKSNVKFRVEGKKIVVLY